MNVERGFSLLELLIAFSIMSFSLALFYNSATGSVRTLDETDKYQQAVIFADSILASRESIDEKGWNEAGNSPHFSWEVRSKPYITETSKRDPNAVPLHEIKLTVSWNRKNAPKQLLLNTILPQHAPIPSGENQ